MRPGCRVIQFSRFHPAALLASQEKGHRRPHGLRLLKAGLILWLAAAHIRELNDPEAGLGEQGATYSLVKSSATRSDNFSRVHALW
jgi:hypothetical protein